MTPRDLGGGSLKNFNGRNLQSGGMYVLGNVFLTNYYAVYDLEEMRVGLVAAKATNVELERGVGLLDISIWSQSGVILVVLVTAGAICIGVNFARKREQQLT